MLKGYENISTSQTLLLRSRESEIKIREHEKIRGLCELQTNFQLYHLQRNRSRSTVEEKKEANIDLVTQFVYRH